MKKKGIIIGSICTVIVCFVILIVLFSKNESKDKNESKQENIVLIFKSDIQAIEYGSTVESKDFIENIVGTINEYPSVDTKVIGKQTITYEVTDSNNNQKAFALELEIVDTQKPIITLKQTKVVLEINKTFDPLSIVTSVVDTVDGQLEYKKELDIQEGEKNYYTYQSNIKLDKTGKYVVNYKAIDINNNESTVKVDVEVTEMKQEVVKQPTIPVTPTAPKEKTQADYTYVLESTVESMKAARNANKIVIVTSTNTTTRTGIAQYFVKENGNWIQKLKTTAYLGQSGMGVGSEGAKKSPIGTYRFTHAYGIKSNPGSLMSYTQLNGNHYWCGDKYYNQFIDESVTNHEDCNKLEKDEHLIDYPGSYDYFAAFNYNSSNTPGKGAAYFLHCGRSYTQGCVAVSTNDMIYLLKNIDISTVFVIAQINNIQNY